jgi:hypothetical protein
VTISQIAALVNTQYLQSISVHDPKTGAEVELEVHRDPESGALLAIDSTFLEQVRDVITSPFNDSTRLILTTPPGRAGDTNG